jgi:hypothetical protein
VTVEGDAHCTKDRFWKGLPRHTAGARGAESGVSMHPVPANSGWLACQDQTGYLGNQFI